MQPTTTIHLGMPKTGTTTLQKQYFTQWQSIGYFGSFGESTSLGHLQFINSAEQFDYLNRRTEICQFFQNASANDKPVLVSKEECLIGHQYPTSTGYADRSLVVERLNDVFGAVQVIVVLRNQFTFLRSFFSQWQRHWYIAQHSFGRWLEYQLQNERRQMGSVLNIPRYKTIFDILAGTFGKENIHFLLYEDLVANPQSFLEQFASIAGVNDPIEIISGQRENQKPSSMATWLQKASLKNPGVARLIPKFIKSGAKKGSSMMTGKPNSLSEREIDLIANYYRHENQAFSETTGIDLGEYDYPMCRESVNEIG